MQHYADRIQAVQKQLQSSQALLITQAADLTYLTGFRPVTHNEREGLLLITTGSAELFAAAFSPLPQYLEEKFTDTGFLKVTRTTNLSRLAASITLAHVDEVQLDEAGIFLSEAKHLEAQLIASADPKKAVKLTTFDHRQLWKLRIIKDDSELKHIRKAADIAKQALTEILAKLHVGQTEKEIAHQFEARLRELGAEGPAFPTIVAFGPHATLPHHQPGSTKLSIETSVLIDCGASVEGYNSDITRTVWFGNSPSADYLKVKALVDQAYQIGLDCLQQRHLQNSSLKAKDIDIAVRTFISDAGFGNQYFHTTGHGIGLEVHEPPSVYQNNDQLIEDGMLITIEPGIYIENAFGYRYENTVLVTSQAPEELTK